MFCLVRYLSNPLPQRDNNCITRKIVHEKYRHFNQLTPQDPWTTRILIQTPRYDISHKRTWDRTQVSYTRTCGKPWLRNMGNPVPINNKKGNGESFAGYLSNNKFEQATLGEVWRDYSTRAARILELRWWDNWPVSNTPSPPPPAVKKIYPHF